MKELITKTTVQNAKAADKPIEVRDTRVKGFLLRVQPRTNVKTFYVEYGRGLRKKLGRADAMQPDDARTEARKILAMAYKGEDPKAHDREMVTGSLKVFIEEVYEPWAIAHLKHGKLACDRVRRNFKKQLKQPLTAISAVDITRWRTKRLAEGKKETTVNRDINGLKAIFSRAVEWKYLDENPLAVLKPMKVDPIARCRYLNNEEMAALIEALDEREVRIRAERKSANEWRDERGRTLLPDLDQLPFADHLKPMVLVSLGTGMRRGELFSLTWHNVDFDQGLITIDGAQAKSGKTRRINMNSEVSTTLREWKKQTNAISGLVLRSASGGKFDNVNTSWEGVLKSAGIEDFRWHDMRHTFASRLAMANVDLNTIRELLGHADYNMTLRYAHLAPSHKAAAVERLVTGRQGDAAQKVSAVVSLARTKPRVANFN